jgi:hypothetical protein
MRVNYNTASFPASSFDVCRLRYSYNPDLQQYADVSPVRILDVGSFAEASKKTLEYIQEWNLSGGNLVAGIFDRRRNGRIIAHVSYNGKVWKVPDEKLLYAPSVQKPCQ